MQQAGFGFNVASNNSFKPTPLRSGKKLAKKACQLFPSTTPRGLTQALGCRGETMGLVKTFYTASSVAVLGIILSACATTSTAKYSRSSTASKNAALEAIIDAQLAAYDRRDVEDFLSYYSEDAKLFNHPNQLTESGKEQLRARYQRSFKNKDVRALIVKRIVFDRFVIDHEKLTGHPNGLIEAIAVYEIKDGKIITVTFYKP
ncbi:nuclear transport factor 2 family protein [Thermomonas sp.]|uniref:nuclear transport factor 2 family protein n=1 Tax=Thermomonas sp. TaxID=1971895 RepID=UPI001EB3C056|nr:nuclear transport factor 2 family protein [Thermomonas sp.]MBK6416277.1 nuclear transport factor 2 family protein [Thermomonas sp.]